jgi:hypothetical protein
MTKEERAIVTGLNGLETIIQTALAKSILNPGTANVTMDAAVASMRGVLRDAYRAGRRDQYVEDEPNLKKKPTLAAKREGYRGAYNRKKGF